MKKKWIPCFCSIVLGIIVIVFAWWELSFSTIILTIAGGLVILRGIINKCCCQKITCETEEKAA